MNNQKTPNLAGFLGKGGVDVKGLEKIFSITVKCHGRSWLASADRFHHGDSLLGPVKPEDRWLALAL